MIAALTYLLLATAAPARANPLPPDVAAFVTRWESCHHFAGEDAYDAERGRFIEQQLRAGRCDRLLQDERRLKRRHAENPAALAALANARAVEPDWPGPPLP